MSNIIGMIVDMQKGLVDRHPYKVEGVVETIQKVAEQCRNHGIEIVYVQHRDEQDQNMKPGTPGFEIIDELVPQKGEKIFEKQYNSAFFKTGLKQYLIEQGIENIIIMGMQTEFCMDATVKAAFEHGFHVFVPENSNTTFDNEYLPAIQTIDYYQYKIWNQRYAYVKQWNPIECFWWKFLCDSKKPLITKYYEAFYFASSQETSNHLLKRVLSGEKRATVSSLLTYENENALPRVGSYSIVTDWNGYPKCIIETTAITILPFRDITLAMCQREGEEDMLEEWQQRHSKLFMVEGDEMGYRFTEDMLVVFEDFRMVYQR